MAGCGDLASPLAPARSGEEKPLPAQPLRSALGVPAVALCAFCLGAFSQRRAGGAVAGPTLLAGAFPVNPWCATAGVPKVKCVVSSMDGNLNVHTFDFPRWEPFQKPYWAGGGEKMEYVTNWTPDKNCLNTAWGLHEWFAHEHAPFNVAFRKHSWTQMMNIGEDLEGELAGMGSTTTYANLEWSGSLCGIHFSSELPPRGFVRIWDFYHLVKEDGRLKIKKNWMTLDLPLLMKQSLHGRSVLPDAPSGTDGDLVLLPRSNDGVPAPTWYAPQIGAEKRKQVKETALRAVVSALGAKLESEIAPKVNVTLSWKQGCAEALKEHFDEDLQFCGSLGVGVTRTLADFCEFVQRPLLAVFKGAPRFELDTVACEQRFCGFHGHLVGEKRQQWMDEPLTAGEGRLRVGLHTRVEEKTGKVADLYFMADVPKWYADAGEDLWRRMERMRSEASQEAKLRR